MPIYTASFSAYAATKAQDVFQITAPSTNRIRIREIRIGQYTDFGDAAAEILSVTVLRGGLGDGSNAGDTGIDPVAIHGWKSVTSVAPKSSLLRINDTGISGDTGSNAVTVLSDVMNIAAGWWYYPPEEEMLILDRGQRLVVRLSAPADSVTMNGTMVYEDIGETGP